MALDMPKTLDEWNALAAPCLPGTLGITFEKVEPTEVVARVTARMELMAPNGFFHGGSVVALADTCCGFGTVRSLPEGATGFTTIDLSTNFLSTTREGDVVCRAAPLHQGRSTQVWDATVTSEASGRVMAHFRCTQMVLWPRG